MTRTAPARTALTLLVGTLLSLCGTTTLDAAVEIRITSGDLITGDISQETDTTVQLKRVIMIRHKAVESTITLQKSTITSRKEVPALIEQYKTRAAETLQARPRDAAAAAAAAAPAATPPAPAAALPPQFPLQLLQPPPPPHAPPLLRAAAAAAARETG